MICRVSGMRRGGRASSMGERRVGPTVGEGECEARQEYFLWVNEGQEWQARQRDAVLAGETVLISGDRCDDAVCYVIGDPPWHQFWRIWKWRRADSPLKAIGTCPGTAKRPDLETSIPILSLGRGPWTVKAATEVRSDCSHSLRILNFPSERLGRFVPDSVWTLGTTYSVGDHSPAFNRICPSITKR